MARKDRHTFQVVSSNQFDGFPGVGSQEQDHGKTNRVVCSVHTKRSATSFFFLNPLG